MKSAGFARCLHASLTSERLSGLFESSNTQTFINMSAQNGGRQSPEPEQQTGAQQSDAPATNINDQGGAPSEGTKQANEDQRAKLESNPTHPLAKHAEQTTSKK
ncbi:hypothetical protein PMIN03_008415 [Paraphaeosphaeria minitans]